MTKISYLIVEFLAMTSGTIRLIGVAPRSHLSQKDVKWISEALDNEPRTRGNGYLFQMDGGEDLDGLAVLLNYLGLQHWDAVSFTQVLSHEAKDGRKGFTTTVLLKRPSDYVSREQ